MATSSLSPDCSNPNLQVAEKRPAAALVGAVKVYEKGAVVVRALDGVDVAFGVAQLTAVMGRRSI